VATLSDIRTTVRRKMRDTGASGTWTDSECNDAINQGIDAIGVFYPKDIVSTFATVSAGVFSYAASSYDSIFRIETYSGTSYQGDLPSSIGDGADSGWELHGGVVYLPPSYAVPAGRTLKAFGYGAYIQLSADSSVTDLDTKALNALYVFCQAELVYALVIDRLKFQQWQTDTNNTDTTSLAMAQIYASTAARWENEKQRLKKLRKLAG
jgi:hypothetical protein